MSILYLSAIGPRYPLLERKPNGMPFTANDIIANFKC